MVLYVLAATALGISVQEQLDGTEIGDETQYIAFESKGAYRAERKDKKGETRAKGTWSVSGDAVEVKVDSCQGPACGELGKGYSAQVTIVAERAMAVKSSFDQGPFSSGSYSCHFQGCEKRTGVEIRTHRARPNAMRYLVDFLGDKNRSRDVAAVWWGKKLPEAQPRTQLFYCRREEERARKGAELVARDLAELPWIGKLDPQPGEKDCLYDVLLVVGDTAALPPRH